MLQSPGVKVSVFDGVQPGEPNTQTRASLRLPLVTVTVTFAVGLLASATVKCVRVSVVGVLSPIVSAVFEIEIPASSTSTVRAFASTVASLA